MTDKRYNDQLLTGFLLGELPEAEREAIEAECFSDVETFEQICTVENELIDKYARQKLSRKESERFERYYLTTPARRQKVAFARSLRRATAQVQTSKLYQQEEAREKPVSFWQTLMANWRASAGIPQLAIAMTLILLIGSLWAGFKITALRRDLNAANQERNRFEQRQQELNRKIEELQQQLSTGNAQSDELAKELEQLRQQQKELEKLLPQQQIKALPSPSIASFFLLPGSIRGGAEGAKTLVIAPTIDTVQLQVKFDANDYPSYQVQLRTLDGVQVFSQRSLKAHTSKDGATLAIKIPAKKLVRNDYILTLSGIGRDGQSEDVERYFFRVRNK